MAPIRHASSLPLPERLLCPDCRTQCPPLSPALVYWCFRAQQRIVPPGRSVPLPRFFHGPNGHQVPLSLWLVEELYPIFVCLWSRTLQSSRTIRFASDLLASTGKYTSQYPASSIDAGDFFLHIFCLPACSSVCLLACLLVRLSACLPARPSVRSPARSVFFIYICIT